MHERFFEREKWQQRQKMDVHRKWRALIRGVKPRVNSHFSDPCPPPTRWFPAAAWNEIIFRPRCTSSRYLKHFIRINECECGNVRSEIFDNFFPLLFLFFLFCNGGFFMIQSMWIWWRYVVFFILDWYLIINLKKKIGLSEIGFRELFFSGGKI